MRARQRQVQGLQASSGARQVSQPRQQHAQRLGHPPRLERRLDRHGGVKIGDLFLLREEGMEGEQTG
jgi:hypothetical protein